MNKQNKSYQWVHGLAKSMIVNSINLVHRKMPKNLEIKGDNNLDMVELVNMKKAYEKGLDKFSQHHIKTFNKSNKRNLLDKIVDIITACISQDTAYYFMGEYILIEYMKEKLKHKFTEQEIEDMFREQQVNVLDNK